MTLRLALPLMLLFCTNVFSQSIAGIVRDKTTKLPLEAATVYFDGTTLVGLTDTDGRFAIGSTTNAGKLLIASFVGYETAKIPNPDASKTLIIELEKDLVGLEEVVLRKSPFTRKQMMQAFKEHFVGTSKSARSCTIANEDDLVLYFDTQEKTLTATSRNPLRLTNPYLGYEVTFDLKEFRLEYKWETLSDEALLKSFFSVSSFYKDLNPTEKVLKKRRQAYTGSASHFMNTLAHEQWGSEKFEVFVGQTQINPKVFFSTKDTLGIKKVSLIKEPQIAVRQKINPDLPPTPENLSQQTQLKNTPFCVFYDKENSSWLTFTARNFLVDDNGNYLPTYGIMLSGYMGSLKAGDMLPSDYYQTYKAQGTN